MNQLIIECTRSSGANSALQYLRKADESLTFTIIPDNDHPWGLGLETDMFHLFFINTILSKRCVETLLNKLICNEKEDGSICWIFSVKSI